MSTRSTTRDGSPYPDSMPLVLDLAGVESLSPAGLVEVFGLQARLEGSGGRLVLVNVSPGAYRSLANCGLLGLIKVRRAKAEDVNGAMKP